MSEEIGRKIKSLDTSLSSVVDLPDLKAYGIWRKLENPEGDLISYFIRSLQNLFYDLRVGVPADFKYQVN